MSIQQLLTKISARGQLSEVAPLIEKYRSEYAAQRAAYLSMGHTECEYITSRLIDDGQLSLEYGGTINSELAAALEALEADDEADEIWNPLAPVGNADTDDDLFI